MSKSIEERIVDRMAREGISEAGLQRLGELELDANMRRWSRWHHKGFAFSRVDLLHGAVVWSRGADEVSFSEEALRRGEITEVDVRAWIDRRYKI